MPETPLDALGPVAKERVIIDNQTFVIARPSESDRILDHPAIRAAFDADEYLPYWADLWPAARMLAKVILHEPLPPGLEALEIGCGLGLPGVVALSRGLRVTFSDYDATALRFAADNAKLNGFNDFRLLPLDWRSPPEDLQWPLVLGSDLIYELRNVAPLVALFKKVLRPDGVCLLTDQDRIPAHALREGLTAEGFDFAAQVVRAGEPGGRRLKGTLYRIRRPSQACLGSEMTDPIP
jgi:predicted nicotinamide N-methyase